MSRLRLVAVAAGFVILPAAHSQDGWLDELLNLGQGDALDGLFADLPTEPDELATELAAEVAELRGLGFREPINVSNQSMGEFAAYLDAEMARSLPPERSAVYGLVVNKLGLYRGAVIEDASAMMRRLATSQVAAYYDPDASAFYVLLPDASPSLLAPVYAHELYHGLQDQHWDLDAYLLDGIESGLNDDEILARQAVVEGEATYVMNLWMMEHVIGRAPSRLQVSAMVLAQSMLSASSLASLAASGLPDGMGPELEASAAAMDEIPPFLLETMIGAYLKGMAFVHAVAARGWDSVAALYTDPPRSTEQILHPAKWLERDDPVGIRFPDLESEPALADWMLLESNVIGEFQLRVILQEFGLGIRAGLAAAGWDGDRYAVLQRDDELLLLLYTIWDSSDEATEFAAAYRELLPTKYAGRAVATAVEQRGTSVLIVEGGEAGAMEDYLDLLGKAEFD